MTAPAYTTQEIPVDRIVVGQQQLREVAEDDSVSELAEDIAARGLLQPIGAKPTKAGNYQLLWGSRRLAAFKRLGRTTITARLTDAGDDDIKALALVENIHRSQLTLKEEIEAVCYLNAVENKSVEQIAATVHKSRTWVLNRLMVPNLPEHLRDPVLAGDLSVRHLEIISKVPDESAQSYLVSQCLMHRWNSSQLKTIADCYMTATTQTNPANNGTPGIRPTGAVPLFQYECQVCHEKGPLEAFTLVRVHKDGCRSDAIADRSAHQGHRGDGLESHPQRPNRSRNRPRNQKT